MSTRQAADPAGPTGLLATWLVAPALDAVPVEVRERASA